MQLSNLESYVNELTNVKVVIPTIEVIADDYSEPYSVVTHTKEIYDYDSEFELQQKIDEVKCLPGFVGVKKKYIEEKLDKNGEVKVPETYRLTVDLDHA